jgi:cobyrinic acid a,c-diamide synthase
MRSLILAGTQSGAGKTTATLALLQHMHRQGRTVAPFKSGPDFLDPLWHQAVTSRPSYNLDTQMMEPAHLHSLINKQSADYAIIEGVMGMFDGRGGVGGKGSSAHLAQQLQIPVLLVVNAKGMSGSLVPLVNGFVQQAKSMDVTISGIIANQVGSENHANILRDLLAEHQLPPLIAWIEKNAPTLPERHLGLVRPGETTLPDLSTCFHVDDEQLLAAFGEFDQQGGAAPKSATLAGKHIAIARDEACCFIYQANLDWLKDQGAEIHLFSPVAGEPLPDECDALWLPGGYPELYASQLAKSTSWPSIRLFIEQGGPVLAECGGMMLLGETLTDHQGKQWPMAGALPFDTRMQDKLASLGYRQLENGLQGHEFHHSVRDSKEQLDPCFNVERGDKGIQYKQVKASYIHWYFPSAPEVVAEWLQKPSPRI